MTNNDNVTNLFVLVGDDDATIRRIPLTAVLNNELAQLFTEQQCAFMAAQLSFPHDFAIKHHLPVN